MDPKNINWKLVTAVLIGLGYVAYRNKGLKNIMKAVSKHGTVAAVLAVVAYFGWDFVMNRVQKELPQPSEEEERMAAEMASQGPDQSLSGYGSIEEQGMPSHMQGRVMGPGGYAAMPSLGC